MRFVTVFDEAGAKVRLDRIPTAHPKKVDKVTAKEKFEELNAELFELQDLMWGAKTHSLLVVLQGRDAAGKDGTVKHLSGGFNPRGVSVVSFGVPTEEELQHDFLWRVHKNTPRLGRVAIFNRSHYEEVLVARVHKLVPKSLWKKRYGHINDFEALLAEQGHCIVIKYFLHISREEQEERLLAREKDPVESWKLSINDWIDRERWDDFTAAYEDAISECAAPHAPWLVVPSDSKWFRNLAVADSLVAALRPYRKQWQEVLEKQGRERRATLLAWRKRQAAAERSRTRTPEVVAEADRAADGAG